MVDSKKLGFPIVHSQLDAFHENYITTWHLFISYTHLRAIYNATHNMGEIVFRQRKSTFYQLTHNCNLAYYIQLFQLVLDTHKWKKIQQIILLW